MIAAAQNINKFRRLSSAAGFGADLVLGLPFADILTTPSPRLTYGSVEDPGHGREHVCLHQDWPHAFNPGPDKTRPYGSCGCGHRQRRRTRFFMADSGRNPMRNSSSFGVRCIQGVVGARMTLLLTNSVSTDARVQRVHPPVPRRTLGPGL